MFADAGIFDAAERGYDDLQSSRLISDWILNDDDPNQRLKQYLGTLRKLCRDLGEINKYAVRYLQLRPSNIVGANGFKFQSRVTDQNGIADKFARNVIEEEFADWRLAENCTTAGKRHHRQVERTLERSIGTDGEALIWVFPGYDNAHRFAIRVIEPDWLDHELNIPKLDNGNRIELGKEMTPAGRCVAFWIDGEHPGGQFRTYAGRKRTRVPAIEEFLRPEGMTEALSPNGYILHQFEELRPGQLRGVPDMIAAVESLRHLDRTEEAHHNQARGASCFGLQEVSTVADVDDIDYSKKSPTFKLRPGFMARPGRGREYKMIQPNAPNTAMPAHAKQTLQGTGGPLNATYADLSGDLSATNYSSARTGAITTQDVWMTKQDESICCRFQPIFHAWLRTRLFFGLRNLRPEREKQYRRAHIQGRRWPWVDPLKDAMGKRQELAMRITSPQRVMAQQGLDPEEVLEEWKTYEEMVAGANLAPTEFREIGEDDLKLLAPLSEAPEGAKLEEDERIEQAG